MAQRLSPVAPRNLLVGQAGVHRVASELQLRGVGVFFPSVDTGVDLILDNGIRVQVKAASIRVRTRSSKNVDVKFPPAYWFSLGWSQQGNRHRPVKRPRDFSEEVDYVVLWGIDEDRFWVVPASHLDGHACLCIHPKRKSPLVNAPFINKVYAAENCWHYLTREGELEAVSSVPSAPPVSNREEKTFAEQ